MRTETKGSRSLTGYYFVVLIGVLCIGTLLAVGPLRPPRVTPPGFVGTCGTNLCLNGEVWHMHGATLFQNFDNLRAIFALTREAKLNSLRAVNFWNENFSRKADPFNEDQWVQFDRFLVEAKRNNIFVILDLSDYRNWLQEYRLPRVNPYTHDWAPFIKFVANRKNTISGVLYKNDPTIFLISFAGEPEPPTKFGMTSKQLVTFYAEVEALWLKEDPNHLVNSGGLSYLDWDSGIDYERIFALSSNHVCAIHTYSLGDLTATLPKIARFCQGMNKPWITEEFGFRQRLGDDERASWFQQVYDLQRKYGSAGSAFWNLGFETSQDTKSVSFDVGTTTRKTLGVIQDNSPPRR